MALKVGDSIPFFTSVDANGNPFDIREYIGNLLVIFFYPKDDTRICTIEACSFRDHYQEFKDLGAEVIGVSADSVKSHLKFKSKYNLPFILLSDADKKLRKLFDVPNTLLFIPGRQTYVVDKSGKIQMVFNSTSGEIHMEKALQMLQEIH